MHSSFSHEIFIALVMMRLNLVNRNFYLCSCSPVSTSPFETRLEPAISLINFIYICNFILLSSCSSLCSQFARSKSHLGRPIALYVVGNQWSNGVMVAGSNYTWFGGL